MKFKDKIIKLKKNKLAIVLLIVLACLVFIPMVTTFSRYVIRNVSEHYYNSKNFYFSSSVLKGETYDLYNWDGISTYNLDVDVSNSKDTLNWTKYDINYEIDVTCSSTAGDVNCIANGDNTINYNNSFVTVGNNVITLDRGTTVFSDGDTATINVVARSTDPYEKELSATFIIHINHAKTTYSLEDSVDSHYFNLIIGNTDINKTITINYDASLVGADDTNYYVINATKGTNVINDITYTTLTFDINKNNVYAIRFYKNNIEANYTLNNSVLSIS